MNHDSAFSDCPRCGDLIAASRGKCLKCGYRPRTCWPTAREVAGAAVFAVALATFCFLLAFL